MFKTNLKIHILKQVLDILQHTRLLVVFFSPVFAYMSFLNMDDSEWKFLTSLKLENIFFCNGERI